MSILVTGGAGYIGSHMCMLLKKNHYLPICFDNLSTGHEKLVKWGPLIKGDLQDVNTLEKTFIKYKPKAVMHFAANALVSESIQNPLKYYDNNVISTINLLKVMKKYKVKYFIFSSSCATYGNVKTIPITEDSMQYPVNPYGRSKLMIEQMLSDLNNDFFYSCLRYFNAAGADLNGQIGEDHKIETHLIPSVILSALKNNPVNIFGNDYKTKDGTAIRDYIHVLDIVDAHLKTLNYLFEHKKRLNLNLGSGKGFSVLEIIQAIQKHSKLSIKINFMNKRPGDPPHLLADNSKAKKILNWSVKHDLTSIIKSAWNWHKKAFL